MKLRNITVIALLAIVMVVVAGCSGSNEGKTVQSKGPITIGFITPLTGDVSFIGQQNKAAVEIAVEEINAKGGVNDRELRVIYEDGKCNAKDGLSAVNKLININKVNYIIGAGCSGETLAAAPIAEVNKVIMLSPLSSSPDITDAGDYIFRNYVNDNDGGKVLAREMYNAGFKDVAMIVGLSDWATGAAGVFEKEFVKLGGKITLREEFTQGETDLRSVITKVKQSNPDAVAGFTYTKSSVAFLKQSKELGLDVPKWGPDTYSDPDIIKEAGSASEGTRYVIPADFSSSSFVSKIIAKTGEESITPGTANAYDAAYILANAIAANGEDTTKAKEWLYNMPAYKGESGVVEFDSNGDLKSPKFAMWEVQNREAVQIK